MIEYFDMLVALDEMNDVYTVLHMWAVCCISTVFPSQLTWCEIKHKYIWSSTPSIFSINFSHGSKCRVQLQLP